MPGGPPRDPLYWQKWRAAHPDYRAREKARRAAHRAPRADRAAEYARRASRAVPVLPVLFPWLRAGQRLSFWEDELRMDLEQERALATLEGRDPEEAAREYRARETSWHLHTCPLADWR